jgi:HTH-type transcriptional regulator, sugar sensing transcriptional regulator
MDYRVLLDVGLSETEAKCYLALLRLGSGMAGQITKEAQINRTNVYDALDRLIEKGLASYVLAANRKVFEPANPKRLKEILKEKENRLQDYVAGLDELYNEKKVEEIATIYKGKKGLKTVYEHLLRLKKPIYVYGATGKFSTLLPAYRNYWHATRVKQKQKLVMLYSESVKNRQRSTQDALYSARFLPKEYVFPSTILICGEVVVTVTWSDTPLLFVITNKGVAKSHMSFFTMLWKIAKI